MSPRWLLCVGLLLAACQSFASTPSALPPIVRILNFWEPITATLSSSEEVHEWQFVAQAGDAIIVRALERGQPVLLALHSADGQTLTEGERVEFTLPAGGIYTVSVRLAQEGSATYALELGYLDRVNPTLVTATPVPEVVGIPTPTQPYAGLGTFMNHLTEGEQVGNAFLRPDEQHVYTFNGQSGQYLTIEMARVNGQVDPVITLYNPSGEAMATDDNSGSNRGAAVRDAHLRQDGLYTIQATGDGFIGSYSIVVTTSGEPAPTPTAGATATLTPLAEALTPTLATAMSGNSLADHVPVIGRISRPGDFDRYPIFAAAGEVLTIGTRAAEGSTLRPSLEVYDPAGGQVAAATVDSSNAGGDVLIPLLVAEMTGAYVVFVTGENDTIGDYVISFGRGASRENVLRGPAEPDQTYESEVARRGLRDLWSIYLNQGDVITAAVRPLDTTFDPVLELSTDDGAVISRAVAVTGDESTQIAPAQAPVSGVYTLRVIGANAATSGRYSLVWHYINLAPTATPEPARRLVLSVDDTLPDNSYLFYPFQGEVGQQVLIRVIAVQGSSLDPVAALLAPDSSVIAQGDDSTNDLNPRFVATLPVDGTYTVRVNGYLSSGPFELTVELLFP